MHLLQAAGVAAGALGVLRAPTAQAATRKRDVKIAGYSYDRVRAIQDGRLGLQGHDVSFHVEDIYQLNAEVFGPARTYEVSETGLIPFVIKAANAASSCPSKSSFMRAASPTSAMSCRRHAAPP